MEVKNDYHCDDCCFFDRNRCKADSKYWLAAADDAICRAFEYKKIIV